MVRAIRRLWKLLIKSAGIDSTDSEIYLIAHVRKQGLPQDQYVRSGLVAISMIIGGIDELFIENPDADGKDSRYGRMIQHILDQEAFLGRVADPLAGSKVIEQLTDLIVQRVWNEYIL